MARRLQSQDAILEAARYRFIPVYWSPLMRFAIYATLFTAVGATHAAAQSVTLQSPRVTECNNFVVAYNDLPIVSSARGHWISIEEASAPASSLSYRFQYLPSSSRGTATFSSRGLMPFLPYEIRLHLDWDGTRSYTIVDSVPLTISPNAACRRPSLVRVSPSVDQGEPLIFSFQNMKRTDSNWAAIARVSQTAPNFLKHVTLPNVARGEASIATTDLAPGVYELRLFEDWSATREYFVYDRITFTVQ